MINLNQDARKGIEQHDTKSVTRTWQTRSEIRFEVRSEETNPEVDFRDVIKKKKKGPECQGNGS